MNVTMPLAHFSNPRLRAKDLWLLALAYSQKAKGSRSATSQTSLLPVMKRKTANRARPGRTKWLVMRSPDWPAAMRFATRHVTLLHSKECEK